MLQEDLSALNNLQTQVQLAFQFQAQILEPALNIQRADAARHGNFVNQLNNQHQATLRQWRARKRFLIGERGAWAEK